MNAKRWLVLLVGTNPLPNYVVGKYFLEKNICDGLVLVYSEETDRQKGTKEYAKRIRDKLDLEPKRCCFIPLRDVGDPIAIKRDLGKSKSLQRIREECELVHLNYTGGTKSMAVHTYSFLKSKFGKKFESSYLDARRHCIMYDQDNQKEKRKDEGVDLRRHINLDIETLLSLHLYDITQNLAWEDCKFSDFLEPIRQKIILPDKWDVFKEWIKSKQNEKDIIRALKSKKDGYICDVFDAFPKLKRGAIEFLKGTWLEWYVYKEVREILLKENFKISLEEKKHFGVSLKAERSKDRSVEFELDIYILYGYQLIGISVTTSSTRSVYKSKGFEVIHRVRQIGGEESKAILVIGDNRRKAEELQSDLFAMTGVTEDRFIVFGKEDWEDIGKKIWREVF